VWGAAPIHAHAGLGTVLSQEADGLYLSRKLAEREERYSTAEKECLAMK